MSAIRLSGIPLRRISRIIPSVFSIIGPFSSALSWVTCFPDVLPTGNCPVFLADIFQQVIGLSSVTLTVHGSKLIEFRKILPVHSQSHNCYPLFQSGPVPRLLPFHPKSGIQDPISIQFRKRFSTSFSDRYNASRFTIPVNSLIFSFTAWSLDILV